MLNENNILKQRKTFQLVAIFSYLPNCQLELVFAYFIKWHPKDNSHSIWIYFLHTNRNFVSFAVVKSYRSILSIMLLSAYALLLLHDFVPHSHHEHHDNSSLATHAEHEPHQHEHDHHHHGEEEEGTPESSENNGPGVHLTSFHSHSGFEAHHHNLAYRAASKDELVVQVVETALLTSYSGQPKEPSDRSSKYFDHFKSSFSNPLLFSSIGLRAPPALG